MRGNPGEVLQFKFVSVASSSEIDSGFVISIVELSKICFNVSNTCGNVIESVYNSREDVVQVEGGFRIW